MAVGFLLVNCHATKLSLRPTGPLLFYFTFTCDWLSFDIKDTYSALNAEK